MFENRNDAGRRLSAGLQKYKDRHDVFAFALTRGGVVVGYEIAQALNVPLNVIIARKIGFPGQPELAIGAVVETGNVVFNEDLMAEGRLSKDLLKREIDRQKDEIARRVVLYRAGKGLPDLNGTTVILVDDGVATGATIKATISALKDEKVAKLVVALPVGPPETVGVLRRMVDELVCLETPFAFIAVSAHYYDFTQVSDDEVVSILRKSSARAA
jgi:putative phosphoribosyl transferase